MNTYTYFQRTAGTQHNNAADWTQINKNIAAVISTNGTAAPSVPLDQKFNSSYVLNTASTATDKVFSAGYISDNYSTSAGSKAAAVLDFPAGSWELPASTFPEDTTIAGTNGDIYVYRFDDGGAEECLTSWKVPPEVDTSANMTFEITGFAVTATASKNVEFTTSISAAGDSEDWDVAFNTYAYQFVTDSTQGSLDIVSFTRTYAQMGVAAGDHLRMKLGRTPASANELSGDYAFKNLRITLPRT